MVQVQSTLFPLYDRNPQTFVPNIFDAKPGDYQKATQRIWRAPGTASFISLPIVPFSSSLRNRSDKYFAAAIQHIAAASCCCLSSCLSSRRDLVLSLPVLLLVIP